MVKFKVKALSVLKCLQLVDEEDVIQNTYEFMYGMFTYVQQQCKLF